MQVKTRYALSVNNMLIKNICTRMFVINNALIGALFLFSLANHFGNKPSLATINGSSPASNVQPSHAPKK